MNCIDRHVDDPEIERTFFTERLRTWSDKSQTAQMVIDSFEQAASPSRYMDALTSPMPAPNRATFQWMGPVCHALWLARNDVAGKTATASAAFRAAKEAFTHVEEALAKSRTERSSVRDALVAFGDNLRELSRQLYGLPDEGF